MTIVGKSTFVREERAVILYVHRSTPRRLLLDLLAAEEDLQLRQQQLGQVAQIERTSIQLMQDRARFQESIFQELLQLDQAQPSEALAVKEASLLSELASVVQVFKKTTSSCSYLIFVIFFYTGKIFGE